MKKLNNKGFAISTLLYGLMIMLFLIVFALMSIMGSNRKNTKNLVDVIQDELNRYSMTDITMMYDSSLDDGAGRIYIAPSSGWYKVELWGSKYTYAPTVNRFNKGSYISGMIYLNANDHLYIYLGADKTTDQKASDSYITLSNEDDSTTIMLAPGGPPPGNSATHYKMFGYAGTQVITDVGYTDVSKKFTIEYGEYDEEGNSIKTENIAPIFYDGLFVPNVNGSSSKFKISKIADNSSDNPPGRNSNNKLSNIRYIKDCAEGNDDPSHNGQYPYDVHWVELQAITNGQNIARGKNIITSPDVNATLGGSGKNVITDGQVYDGNKYGTYQDMNGTIREKCITIDLEKQQNLDEVAVWHYYRDGRRYYNHTLSVSGDGNNWTELRHTTYMTYNCGENTCAYSTAESESSVGIRYNSFQPHPYHTENLPEGKYYIFYTGDKDKNTVLTQDSSIGVKLFTAEKNQQWQVSKNNDGTYKITNIDTKNSLEKSENNVICKNKDFNNNQKWNISSGNDAGFYSITDPTRSAPAYGIKENMTLSVSTALDSSQRFKFVKIN